MKATKLFLGMLAVAGMLFTTSCSKEDVNVDSSSEYVSASFNIGAAGVMGTRAIGEGTLIDKVACAVYDENGVELENLYEIVDFDQATGKAVYNVRLAKGQDYRVAFFAYNEAAAAYNVDDLKSVKILAAESNVEGRDAFTNYQDIEAAELTNLSNVEKTVVLKRPFAQLNLGIDAAEVLDAAKAGIIVSKSQITVSNVYNAFSAFANTVATDATLGSKTFALNEVPAENLYVNGNAYQYLALNYILVGDQNQEKSLTDVEFVWETADGKTNLPTTHFINIPVQRNYRTNILGRLLTTPAEFTIEIDADFQEPDYVEDVVSVVTKTASTAAELASLINNAAEGQTIINLTANITSNEVVVLDQLQDRQILVNGNGKTVNASFFVKGHADHVGIEGLSFDNVRFDYTGSESDIFTLGDRTADGRYVHNVIFNDCYFRGSDKVAIRPYQSFDIAAYNCEAIALHSFIQATGGNDIKISGCLINAKRGMSLGTTTNVVVENTFINAADDKYGIRADVIDGNSGLKIIDSKISAFIPVVVRNSNNAANVESYVVTFEGNNVLEKMGGSEYHVAIANEEYDTVGDTLTPITGADVTGANASWTIFK